MKRIWGVMFVSFLMYGICFGVGEINIAYSPYTISKPGAYMVVKDLPLPESGNCIEIITTHVSIDLNGHTLYGQGTASGNPGDGIYGAGPGPITISNGQITNFNDIGIFLGQAQVHISKVKLTDNTQQGIVIDGGIIENCMISHNGNSGIVTYNNAYPAIISGNEISGNGWNINQYGAVIAYQNCKIVNNTLSYNSIGGIYTPGGNVTISDNVITYNTGDIGNQSGMGIYANGNDCNIFGNTITNNQNYGIRFGGFGSRVKGNTISENGYIGIKATDETKIIENTLFSNASGGIVAHTGCTISDNDITNSGLSGISITGLRNSIQNNTIFSNATGLSISTAGNFWAGNIFRSNTVSTSIAAGNTFGSSSTSGFNNLVVPYADMNFGIRQFAGFDMPAIQESREAVLHELKW